MATHNYNFTEIDPNARIDIAGDFNKTLNEIDNAIKNSDQAIGAETARAEAAEQANAQAIGAAIKPPISFGVEKVSEFQTLLVCKMQREYVKPNLSFTNGQNSQATATVFSAISGLSDNTLFAINCDRFDSANDNAYNFLMGNEVFNAGGVSSSATNANFLAFKENGDPAIFTRAAYTPATIKSAGYSNAFVAGYQLIENGASNIGAIPQDYYDGLEPSQVFAWDDASYFVFMCYGRSGAERGISPKQLIDVALKHGCKNAILLDGGGSVQGAIKNEGFAAPISVYPSAPRYVPLTLSFETINDALPRINAASYAAIAAFNSQYDRNKMQLTSMRELIRKNVALAKDSIVAEKVLFANESTWNSRHPNASKDCKIVDYSDAKFNSGTIKFPLNTGSSWYVSVITTIDVDYTATSSGTLQIFIDRETAEDPYYTNAAVIPFVSGANHAVFSAITNIGTKYDAETPIYITTAYRANNAPITINSIRITDTWNFGAI